LFGQELLSSSFVIGLLPPRLGTTTHDTCTEDMYSTLLQRYQRSEEELRKVAEEWLECQKRIDAYVDEQVNAALEAQPAFWGLCAKLLATV
jgi:hypothetical protein